MRTMVNRKGSALISLFITLVIIGIVFWLFTKTRKQSEERGTMMRDAGIDTSSYKGMLDSARTVAENASKPKQ